MLSRSLRMSAAKEMFAFHARRTVIALVAILCPACLRVSCARDEPLPRGMICSRCRHKHNFSRQTRSTKDGRYVRDRLMPGPQRGLAATARQIDFSDPK
jgi:hypothetical protein